MTMEVLSSLNTLAGKISPTSKDPDKDAIKMFVGQVPRSMDEDEIMKLFQVFGPVFQLNVLRDKATGVSRGCCFVTFYKRKHALDAQNALHNVKTLQGMHHPIQMKPADTENRNERKLFIGMVSKRLSEDDIKQMFAVFGPIEECTILRDDNGISRGCAFVTFTSRSVASSAIKAMHHSTTMEGCSSPLVVKFADTQKEKEHKKLQQLQTSLWTIAGTSPHQNLLGSPLTLGIPHTQLPALTNQTLSSLTNQGLPHLTSQQLSGQQLTAGQLSSHLTGQQLSSQILPQSQLSQLIVPYQDGLSGQTGHQYSTAQLNSLNTQLNGINGINNAYFNNQLVNGAHALNGGISGLNGHTVNGLSGGVNGINGHAVNGLNGTVNGLNGNGTHAVSSLNGNTNGLSGGGGGSANGINGGAAINGLSGQMNGLNGQINGHLGVSGSYPLSYLGGYSSASLIPNLPLGLQSHLAGLPALTQSSALAQVPGLQEMIMTSLPSDVSRVISSLNSIPVSNISNVTNGDTLNKLESVTKSTSPRITEIKEGGKSEAKSHEGPDGANLFIYHLPAEFTDSDLLDAFQPFGTVISAKVFVDKYTNLSKCFGFVSFTTSESALSAIQAMNGFQVGTKRLKVQHKRSREAGKPY